MRVLIGLLTVTAILSGCRNTGPPTIVKLEGPTEVGSSDTAELYCQAWDWYLEPIRFYWTASRGTVFEQSDGPTRTESYARWRAPESSGAAVISVAVVDLDSMVTRDSVVIRVNRVTRTVLNLDGLLKPGQARNWTDSLSFGHRFQGWFDVDTGRVAFRLLDSRNFQRWSEGESYEALYEVSGVSSETLQTALPASGRFHMVLDNRAGELEQRFRMRFTTTTP